MRRAVICGAGIAGLAAARFLAERNWEVVLVEKAPGLRTAGYMIDFMGTGFDAVEKDGLLPDFLARHHDFDRVAYVNEDGGVRSTIDYALTRSLMNNRLLALTRGDIERALHAALPEKVDLRYATTVDTIAPADDGVTMTLTDGTQIAADLLIGADGIHSDVRAQQFGTEGNFLRYLGYHTAAYVFEDESIEAKMQGQFQMLTVPNRQVGCYPMGGGRIAAFFAHAQKHARRPTDPMAALTEAYGDLGWIVPRLLAAAPARDIYYDLVAQIEMPRWHKGRVVLLGDAAYAVSLLAGQGASMAVGGAYKLAEYLDDAPIDAALEQFEAELKPEIEKKQAAGRRTANWFVPPTRFHNGVRDLFLNATRLPGLRWMLQRFFAPSTKSLIRN